MSTTSKHSDHQPDVETATIVVEAKAQVTSARALRDALAQLASYLATVPGKQGYLLLVDPRITSGRADEERSRLARALRPEIAKRVHILVCSNGQFEEPPSLQTKDLEALASCIGPPKDKAHALPRPDKQSEVFRVILHQWIAGKGPITSNWLAETVGCNYRTVVAAIEKLGDAIQRLSDRRIKLKYFPLDALMDFLAIAPASRAPMSYVDRSGQPRSPESLVRRLRQLERSDIAVGGVLGAKYHYGDLDIVGAPRLDLCIHAPGKSVDLSFVHRLDPGLQPNPDTREPGQVALHFVRRDNPLFYHEGKHILWADPVECLLDLYEARLKVQASAFATFLKNRGEIQSA